MTAPHMRDLQRSIVINAPAARVWDLISRFELWPTWGPTVRAVESRQTHVSPGASGRVRTPLGVWLPFRITDVDPGRSWTWEVAGVRATGHELTAIDGTRTRVTFTTPLAAAPYTVIIDRGLQRLKSIAERAVNAESAHARTVDTGSTPR